MPYHLTVISAFGAYAVGARITDPAEVAAVLASENARDVVKITAPPSAPPAPAKS